MQCVLLPCFGKATCHGCENNRHFPVVSIALMWMFKNVKTDHFEIYKHMLTHGFAKTVLYNFIKKVLK